MERILEIGRELTSTQSLERLLHQIVEAAVELTDSEMGGILLFDERAGELRFTAANTICRDRRVSVPLLASPR
jgi:GAF domain-containing protein